MNAPAKVAAPTGLALLRQPFPDHQISKLPKETRAQIDARKSDRTKMVWNCEVCGGHHHKDAVHLDYVGHAALTDRLLDTDIEWSWEPVAFAADGLPAFDRNGGLWIKLTVGGVTRLGYGAADGKSGGDAIKEIIGDALRNAAMRFGAALDLWHKGDLHLDDDPASEDEPPAPITKEQFRQIQDLAVEAGISAETICRTYEIEGVTKLPAAKFDEVATRLRAEVAKKKEAKGFADADEMEFVQ